MLVVVLKKVRPNLLGNFAGGDMAYVANVAAGLLCVASGELPFLIVDRWQRPPQGLPPHRQVYTASTSRRVVGFCHRGPIWFMT